MRFAVAVLAVAVAVTGCHAPLHTGDVMYAPGHAGPIPGTAGPGPGVVPGYQGAMPGGAYAGGGYAGECLDPNAMAGMPGAGAVVQVAFVGPEGMVVNWDVSAAGMFDSEPLVFPARYDFPSGAIYRLKLTNIPSRPGVELYPSLEVGPPAARSMAFLAHNAMPVQFTEQDFDQVLSGNFVTKVIYLPDPEFQELAVAGVDTLVSTRLDPGVDPIVEADRRGSILGVIRLGNRDLQIPGTEMAGGMMQPTVAPQAGMGTAGNYISGVTGPEYGMPLTAAPHGLPGAATLPIAPPAGLHPRLDY